MRPYRLLSIAAALLCLSLGAGASCYTVYDPKGQLVFRSSEPPVDLARDLHDTVPVRFGPGASMVFTPSNAECTGVGAGADTSTGATSGYMTGLTNNRTVNATYIRSTQDDRRSAAPEVPSSRPSGFGNPAGTFPGGLR